MAKFKVGDMVVLVPSRRNDRGPYDPFGWKEPKAIYQVDSFPHYYIRYGPSDGDRCYYYGKELQLVDDTACTCEKCQPRKES